MDDCACTIYETPPKAAIPEAGTPTAAKRERAQSATPPGAPCAAAADAGTPAPRPSASVKWHKKDMPRERLFDGGPGVLSDTEMIVLVLGSGLPGHNVFEVARALLDHFGSLRAMLDASHTDFEGLRGIGPAKRRSCSPSWKWRGAR